MSGAGEGAAMTGQGIVGGFSRVAFLKITMNVRLVLRESRVLVATCRHFILFVCRVFCGMVVVAVVVVVVGVARAVVLCCWLGCLARCKVCY